VWIAIGFWLPVFALFVVLALGGLRRGRSTPWIAARRQYFFLLMALAAIPAITAVLSAVNPLTNWPASSQIAWTGVEAANPAAPVAIGGRRDQALVAWPNGSFEPQVAVHRDRDAFRLVTRGGGAFVRVENGEYVNGVVVQPGHDVALGDFVLAAGRYSRLHSLHAVIVQDRAGGTLATVRLPSRNSDRVYRLSVRLAPDVRRLRANGTALDRDLALALEDWAADKLMLVTREGEIRVLGREESPSFAIRPPCNLVVQWPPIRRQRLQVLFASDGRLAVAFPPPWSVACPLPTAGLGTSAGTDLTFTARAVPGDRAFILPLGDGVADPRQTIPLTIGAGGAPVFTSDSPVVPEPLRQDLRSASRARVTTKNGSFEIVATRDLPRFAGIATLVLMAWVSLGLSLIALNTRLSLAEFRPQAALLFVIWTLLCLRIMLAFRYAAEPDHLDGLALKGIAVAMASAVAVPAAIAFAVRLHRDGTGRPEDRKAQGPQVLVFLLIAATLSMLEFLLAPRLWPNLPAYIRPSLIRNSGGWMLPLSFVGALLLWLVRYHFEAKEASASKATRGVANAIRLPFLFLEWARTGRAAGSWNNITRKMWDGKRTATAVFLVGVVVAAAYLTIAITHNRVIQELVVPALLMLLPGLVVLSAVHRESMIQPTAGRGGGYVLAIGLLILIPILAVPYVIKDVGGILAALAVFIPIALVVLCSQPRRAGALVAAGVAIPILLGITMTGTVRQLPSWASSIATVRILSYVEGDALQRDLPRAILDGKDASGGLPLHNLREALEHQWENRAMAHVGGTFGLGPGQAPVRRSAVPQDTIQFDSAFSFFILGEHGLVGGGALILLYASPLMVVLWSARRRFDFGHAVAIVACSALLLEALFHMAMNLGVLPFTGRNLPLLAVNSITDPTRWALLMMVAGQTMLWRSDRMNDSFTEEMPPIHENFREGRGVRTALWLVVAFSVILLVPARLAFKIIERNAALVRDANLDRPFSWRIMLDSVQAMIDRGLITVDQNAQTLNLNRELAAREHWPLTGWSLTEQEIARFNAMTGDERFDGRHSTRQLGDAVRARVRSVATVEDFDRLMGDLREADVNGERSRPGLFLFHEVPRAGGSDADSLVVVANPDYNGSLSFRRAPEQSEIGECRLGGKTGPPLIGPAWVMGRWERTYLNDDNYPWAGQLAGALDERGRAVGGAATVGRVEFLTLDPALQPRVQAFARELGRQGYAHALSQHAANRLPTRAAVTVLSLPGGEIRAMGGWPRMSPGRSWGQTDHEPMPPAHWVASSAPRSLRARYDSDRNLDWLVMGSASKPLWASAVLSLHPDLNNQLLTRGDDRREEEVFGLRVPEGDPWEVKLTAWADWNTYLAKSDNRYHVRVGFLGLAQGSTREILAGGPSPSRLESLNGKPEPWGRFPVFQTRHVEVGSGALEGVQEINALKHLDESDLAQRLHTQYGIDGRRGAGTRRMSFWTADEADDLPDSLDILPLLANLSPVAPNFEFDRIRDGRAYVALLLGGLTNTWANVDFAAAFGTCITGRPVIAHIASTGGDPKPAADRVTFPEQARAVRPGLARVITAGTATTPLGPDAQAFLASLDHVDCYAKTGTMSAERTLAEGAYRNDPPVSRLVLALVRWDNERAGKVKRGLVISVVVERAGQGMATEAVGRFLVENEKYIRRELGLTDGR